MGANLTTFENDTVDEVQLRFFRPPARPDRYRRIITIRAGAKARIAHRDLRDTDVNPERPEVIMIFVNGVYAGVGMAPRDMLNYSRVICGRNENNQLTIRRVPRFNILLRRCGCFAGQAEDDIVSVPFAGAVDALQDRL